jgi:two-component system, NtrC family, sensor histidine kinase AtoS
MNTPSPLSNLALRKRFKPNSNHFEALLELFPGPAFVIDQAYERILLANTPAVELTAFTRFELSRANVSTLFPSLDRPVLKDLSQEPIQTTAVLRNGRPVEVQINLTPLDAQGSWNLLTCEPFSEITRREAKIERQSKMLEAVRNLIISFQESDSDAALEMAMEAGCTLVGASLMAVYSAVENDYALNCSAVCGPVELLPDHITPNDLVSMQTPHYWSRKKRVTSSLHRAARASNLAFVATAPLGQPNALIGLLVAAGEQESESEEILAIMQILADAITGLVQKQVLISYLKNSLENKTKEAGAGTAVIAASQEAVVILSPELRILELNSTAESILGYASREVEGRPYQHILVGVENIIPPFVAPELEINSHNLGNVHLYRRDGRSFLANVRTLPLTNDGSLESVVIMIQDLSQEEEYRLHKQQLEQRALIGEVSAILAHEFRNPLNNFSTGLDLMEANLPENDQNQEVISRMQQDLSRLEDIIKTTLAFVRPIEYKEEPVNLKVMMPKLLERWLPHMARVNIQYSTQIDASTPEIMGDARSLEQVWTNLIGNAIQAMGTDGGTLVVKVRPVVLFGQSNMVEVSITDTGPGIPDDIKDRIFEPFVTTNRGGTGLGLPLAKRIVTAHRGTIKVTSFPGGTSFQVQLPLKAS